MRPSMDPGVTRFGISSCWILASVSVAVLVLAFVLDIRISSLCLSRNAEGIDRATRCGCWLPSSKTSPYLYLVRESLSNWSLMRQT